MKLKLKKSKINYLLIFIGIVLISYPIISNLVGKYHQTEVIVKYKEEVNNLTDEEKQEEIDKATEYNDSLKDDNKTYDNYLNVLNIGEVIAYINIPKIKVNLPIYHGVSRNVLESGVGHMQGTSLPIGGKGTHAVLSAHTGLVRTKMFDDIDKLEIGDKFYINVLDGTLAYKVDNIKVVLPEEVDSIQIDENEDYITLVTCTPYMINTHRLLVRGTRISLEEALEEDNLEGNLKGNPEDTIENQKIQLRILVKGITRIILIIILLLFILLILLIMEEYEEYKAKREKKGGRVNKKDKENR